MATEKQITANRKNAQKSTGPRTLNGKRKSRRNAVRHGLTAETVIDVIEEAADYEALAAAINVDFRPNEFRIGADRAADITVVAAAPRGCNRERALGARGFRVAKKRSEGPTFRLLQRHTVCDSAN
jgi:hypothetical protein